ncbi:CASP-like protein 5B3 isoform X2 [Prosopis cineraria]|uniref:CASP-like protein 5B3 isoform X2 n=1 Tax=Prosopis cineraria TaxID=364024 RepID=UPI00240F2716|nr:CASP-like protein 5B3 isoform X2 [Prosopis cineraria]
MKHFPGTPGTLTALVLRLSQCTFAVGSIAAMGTTSSFYGITAFCYLIASMGLQVVWSFVLALLDAYALVRKKVTATLSLAAASASAGIAVLYFNDAGSCKFGQECQSLYNQSEFAHLTEAHLVGILSFQNVNRRTDRIAPYARTSIFFFFHFNKGLGLQQIVKENGKKKKIVDVLLKKKIGLQKSYLWIVLWQYVNLIVVRSSLNYWK